MVQFASTPENSSPVPPSIDDYLTKQDRYIESLKSNPNPHQQVLDDIAKRLETITFEDSDIDEIINWMFYPIDESGDWLGLSVKVLGWDWAISIFFHNKINDLKTILIENVEHCSPEVYDEHHQIVEVDTKRELIESEIATIINKRISDLGLSKMPSKVKKRLTKEQKQVLGLLEKMSKQKSKGQYRKTSNSSDIQGLKQVIGINRMLLMNPNQMSMFDDGVEVNYWDESESGSKDAREISVKKKSKNQSEMVLHYGVENFRSLLKHNEQASKLLTFYAERLQDEFDISEYAELTGMRADNAKRSLDNGADVLTNIKYKPSEKGGYIVLFPSILIGQSVDEYGNKIGKRGKVTIDRNPRIDFATGGEFYKLIPDWAYRLNKNAWFLADYIYSLFRMDAQNIDQAKGYHIKRISLLRVLSILNLPHPDSTDRVEQLIIEPIQKAIDEFNQAEYDNHGKMKLSLDLDYQKSPSMRVKDGELIAKLEKGEYFDSLVEIASKRDGYLNQAKEKAEKKQARIDQAKGHKFAMLEYEEKKKKDQAGSNPD